MKPLVGTQPYIRGNEESAPSLGFFKNGEVLSALTQSCLQASSGTCPVDIRLGESCVSIISDKCIMTSKGHQLECD